MGELPLDVHVLVVCQNEADRVDACLRSVADAVGGLDARVTVVVNGSTDGSEAVAAATARACGLPVELWRVRKADKANVINLFVHRLRSAARAYVLVDGYARIGPRTLSAFAALFEGNPKPMAASGIAANGRTERRTIAKTLGEGGVLHGQLTAFRQDFFDRMVAQGIRLPLGLYRGDGLMGSMAAHDLDAVGLPWDNARVAGVAEATYEIKQLSPFRPADLRRQFRRKVRQMRGVLENQAIKDIIYREGYPGLPANADEMIGAYLAAHGVPAVALPDRPFMRLALREVRASRPAEPEALEPVRLG